MSTNTKSRDQYERKPIQELKVQMSEDGKFWILRDITTWIVPVNYFEAIRKNKDLARSESVTAANQVEAHKDGKSNDRAT